MSLKNFRRLWQNVKSLLRSLGLHVSWQKKKIQISTAEQTVENHSLEIVEEFGFIAVLL
jgi:hypothetical protein